MCPFFSYMLIATWLGSSEVVPLRENGGVLVAVCLSPDLYVYCVGVLIVVYHRKAVVESTVREEFLYTWTIGI